MIRSATPTDLDALGELEVDLFGAAAWSPRQIADELDTGSVLVSDDHEGRPAAYVATRVLGDVLDVLRIGVRKDHQRRGLAGILLTAAMQRARAVGVDRLMLEVSDRNDPAVALYHGHGFSVIDRRRGYYADGSDALVMSRPVHATPAAEGDRHES